MDLSKTFAPSTGSFTSKYSDKRTEGSVVNGTVQTTHEGGFIKRIVSFDFVDESPYPSQQVNLIPLSFLKDGAAKWTKRDDPHGDIIFDEVVVGEVILTNMRSIDGELIGATAKEQIGEYEYKEVGFLYNAPDDLLRWVTISKIDDV